MGLGKSRNILIIVNCTKTFLLRPIELLFDTFCRPLINKYACTPSINKYAWIVLDGKDVIFLNNFWCSCKLIPWEAFLVLLEREVVLFPLPKKHFGKDPTISSDVLIFVNLTPKIKHPYDSIESKLMNTP